MYICTSQLRKETFSSLMPEAVIPRNRNYINNYINKINVSASICHCSVHKKSWLLPAKPIVLSPCDQVHGSFTRLPFEFTEQEKISPVIRPKLMLCQSTRSCSSAQKCIKLKIIYVVCPTALMERQFQHITLNYLEALRQWATRERKHKRVILVIEVMIKLANIINSCSFSQGHTWTHSSSWINGV